MVVIAEKWFYSGKSGCIREKVVVFGQSGCIRARSGCIRAKVVVFGQSGCIQAKVVVFVQKWFFSGSSRIEELCPRFSISPKNQR